LERCHNEDATFNKITDGFKKSKNSFSILRVPIGPKVQCESFALEHIKKKAFLLLESLTRMKDKLTSLAS